MTRRPPQLSPPYPLVAIVRHRRTHWQRGTLPHIGHHAAPLRVVCVSSCEVRCNSLATCVACVRLVAGVSCMCVRTDLPPCLFHTHISLDCVRSRCTCSLRARQHCPSSDIAAETREVGVCVRCWGVGRCAVGRVTHCEWCSLRTRQSPCATLTLMLVCASEHFKGDRCGEARFF